jgi:hypothetical protein
LLSHPYKILAQQSLKPIKSCFKSIQATIDLIHAIVDLIHAIIESRFYLIPSTIDPIQTIFNMTDPRGDLLHFRQWNRQFFCLDPLQCEDLSY